ncbi:DUF190 domain-containing protein [Larsenimonas salina]|uniref:DUF190 domain-containing protein n=1 Tax=Larsenimonas salina TaxID=1295565 RepID=UPI00207312B9|nr:DUF190 domain-containing protein [Larsenimonas salina]MCM5705042.1 DUF190 domain-containing protein [Larsenimonas salina]
MNGFEVAFMAPEGRKAHGTPVLDRVIELAKAHGIERYTRRTALDSRGNDHRYHSAHFFELNDRPEEVMFVLDPDKADALIKAVTGEAIELFCVKRPIEYWQLGDAVPE